MLKRSYIYSLTYNPKGSTNHNDPAFLGRCSSFEYGVLVENCPRRTGGLENINDDEPYIISGLSLLLFIILIEHGIRSISRINGSGGNTKSVVLSISVNNDRSNPT